MNIAVVLTKGREEGGAFQYALSLSRLMQRNSSGRYNFVFFTTVMENIKVLEKYDLRFHYLRWSDIDRFFSIVTGSPLLSGVSTRLKIPSWSNVDRVLKGHNIDLLYFLNPSDLALATERFNYIFTVWDLSFLDFMEFPEVYAGREFERRDRLYHRALRRAVGVVTDSDATGKRIAQRYGVDEKRIAPVPFLPVDPAGMTKDDHGKDRIDIAKKHGIKNRYIFYPAQFWPHKNHVYILEGLMLLKEKYKTPISAVFAGSDKGNLSFVLKKAEEFGIADQIHYIGFADDKDMPHLYRQALALVMPTYFGPTNIPPLEAFAAGCPVLYSDLPRLREDVEGAAILLDLTDPDSMCRGLLKIIQNSPEIKALIEKGREKIKLSLSRNRWETLRDIFDGYSIKSKCWK